MQFTAIIEISGETLILAEANTRRSCRLESVKTRTVTEHLTGVNLGLTSITKEIDSYTERPALVLDYLKINDPASKILSKIHKHEESTKATVKAASAEEREAKRKERRAARKAKRQEEAQIDLTSFL